jgi:Sulfatase-modifying factor enzyme 1
VAFPYHVVKSLKNQIFRFFSRKMIRCQPFFKVMTLYPRIRGSITPALRTAMRINLIDIRRGAASFPTHTQRALGRALSVIWAALMMMTTAFGAETLSPRDRQIHQAIDQACETLARQWAAEVKQRDPDLPRLEVYAKVTPGDQDSEFLLHALRGALVRHDRQGTTPLYQVLTGRTSQEWIDLLERHAIAQETEIFVLPDQALKLGKLLESSHLVLAKLSIHPDLGGQAQVEVQCHLVNLNTGEIWARSAPGTSPHPAAWIPVCYGAGVIALILLFVTSWRKSGIALGLAAIAGWFATPSSPPALVVTQDPASALVRPSVFPVSARVTPVFIHSEGHHFLQIPGISDQASLMAEGETSRAQFTRFATACPTHPVLASPEDWKHPLPIAGTDVSNLQLPMTQVTHAQATAYGEWLTSLEPSDRRPRRIYRLPTDAEFSAASGVADADAAYRAARPLAPDSPPNTLKPMPPAFWWGKWPPPQFSEKAFPGNFAGEECRNLRKIAGSSSESWNIIVGYDDGCPGPTSVDDVSFLNASGFIHLSGNVREWCCTPFGSGSFGGECLLIRGGHFMDQKDALIADTTRVECPPGPYQHQTLGFRIVCEFRP